MTRPALFAALSLVAVSLFPAASLADERGVNAEHPASASESGSRPLTVRDALLLTERYDLAHRRTSIAGPTVVLSLGAGLVAAGIITARRADGDPSDGTRSTGQKVGIGLASGGLALIAGGIPFVFVRRARAASTRERIEEIDRQLQVGLILPPMHAEQGSYGVTTTLFF